MIGSKIGLFEVCQCMLNPHDSELLPNPGYPDYSSGVSFVNADPSFMPVLVENEFFRDYTKLNEEVLDRAKKMVLDYGNVRSAAVAAEDCVEEAEEDDNR